MGWLLAAALWCVFVAVRRGLSGRHWSCLLFDLVPPAVYIAVPVGFLAVTPFATSLWEWAYALTLAALVLGAPRPVLSRRTPPPEPETFSVVSWNTLYWHQDKSPEEFYRFLKSLDADVYILQEYMEMRGRTPLQVTDDERLLREFPGYQIVSAGELITISRFPVTSAGEPAPEKWHAQYESVKILRTDLRIADTITAIYNVHIPAQIRAFDKPLTRKFYTSLRHRFFARRAQFRLLEENIDARPGPTLVAGDFNSTSAMAEMRGLFRRCRPANGVSRSLYPGSWPAKRFAPWQLDWIFTRALTVHDYRLLDPQGLSDHRVQYSVISLVTGPHDQKGLHHDHQFSA